MSARLLLPSEVEPEVRMANFVRVDQQRAVWGEREIADLELILVLEGRFQYLEAGRCQEQEAGEVLLILPGRAHSYRRAPECRAGRFSCIHCELLPGRSWLRGEYRVEPQPRLLSTFGELGPIAERFRAVAQTWAGHGPLRRALLRNQLREIWLLLSERWLRDGEQRMSQRTRRMLAWLREHAHRHPGRRELAGRFGLSPQYVNQLFKQELGVSPTEVVQRRCCQLAHQLILEEGLSVQEAARRVGFADPGYFTRIFTRVVGVPPSRV